MGSSRKPPLTELVADAREDLLLSPGAREVRFAGCLAHAGVGQGGLAVEMVAAGGDREAALEAAVRVGRVAEAVGDVDIDAAESVDDRDEAGQVDDGVIVDAQAEERAQGALEDVDATAVGALELARMVPCVGGQGIDLAPEGPAVGQGHVDHVTRDRDHRDRPADRIEGGHDHGVGQVRAPAGAESTPTSRTLTRCGPSVGEGTTLTGKRSGSSV